MADSVFVDVDYCLNLDPLAQKMLNEPLAGLARAPKHNRPPEALKGTGQVMCLGPQEVFQGVSRIREREPALGLPPHHQRPIHLGKALA
jgi:hypothetical protein